MFLQWSLSRFLEYCTHHAAAILHRIVVDSHRQLTRGVESHQSGGCGPTSKPHSSKALWFNTLAGGPHYEFSTYRKSFCSLVTLVNTVHRCLGFVLRGDDGAESEVPLVAIARNSTLLDPCG